MYRHLESVSDIQRGTLDHATVVCQLLLLRSKATFMDFNQDCLDLYSKRKFLRTVPVDAFGTLMSPKDWRCPFLPLLTAAFLVSSP